MKNSERSYPKMKPNTRILNYVTLVQDGVLTLDDVPQDIKKEVTKWVRYLAGIKDESMVKDDTTQVKKVDDYDSHSTH